METPIASDPTPNLQIGFLFSRSWSLFKKNLLLIVGVFFVYFLITNGLPSVLERGHPIASLIQLAVFVIQGPLLAGVYGVALRLTRGQLARFEQMFEGFQAFGKAFGVFVLYFLAISVGIVLLVVPGVIAAVGLIPAMFLVLDANLGVLDTLRKAWAMTAGVRLTIFLVLLALLGLNILGMLALVIGLFFTGAFSLLVLAALYDELSKAHG